jgi:hypothetical protein
MPKERIFFLMFYGSWTLHMPMFLFSQEEELERHNDVSDNNEHALRPERRHRCNQNLIAQSVSSDHSYV